MELAKLKRTLGAMTSACGGWWGMREDTGFHMYNFPETWVKILLEPREDKGFTITVHSKAYAVVVKARVEDIESFVWSKKDGGIYEMHIKDCPVLIGGFLKESGKQKEK